MTSAAIAMAALVAVTAVIVIGTAVAIFLERKGPARMDFNDR